MAARTGLLRCGTIACLSCRLSARPSATAGRRFSDVPSRSRGWRVGSGRMGCGRTQLDFLGHDPKAASHGPGTLWNYGRHTDGTRFSRGGERCIRRSAAIPMGRNGLPVNRGMRLRWFEPNTCHANPQVRPGASTGPDACSGAVRRTVHGACGPVVGQIRAGERPAAVIVSTPAIMSLRFSDRSRSAGVSPGRRLARAAGGGVAGSHWV